MPTRPPPRESTPSRSEAAAPAPDYELMARVERLSARHACNWFGFCHLCAHARCRRANGCRGDPMACLRRHVPQVPAPVRSWVRGIMRAQDDGLSCDEALDDMAEFEDGYFCWIAGLKRRARV
jgi:hypothetical protein